MGVKLGPSLRQKTTDFFGQGQSAKRNNVIWERLVWKTVIKLGDP